MANILPPRLSKYTESVHHQIEWKLGLSNKGQQKQQQQQHGCNGSKNLGKSGGMGGGPHDEDNAEGAPVNAKD